MVSDTQLQNLRDDITNDRLTEARSLLESAISLEPNNTQLQHILDHLLAFMGIEIDEDTNLEVSIKASQLPQKNQVLSIIAELLA